MSSEVPTRPSRLVLFALVLSGLSLGYAGWVHWQMESSLQRRERELVRHWTPQMRSVYADMMPGPNALPLEPATLEELFAPLFRLVNQIGDGGREDGAKPDGQTQKPN